MYDNTANVKRILWGIIVFVIAVIGLTIWHAMTFHAVSTNPSLKAVSTISPFFKVNFNQQLSSSGLQVSSSPAAIIGTPSVSGKVLTIPLNPPLTAGKVYTITLVSVTSVSGHTVTNKTYRFIPEYIQSASLPNDQRQALLKQQTDTGPSTTDPILKSLPYKTTDFTLLANQTPTKNPPQKLPLTAIITLSQADMGDQAAATAQYEQEVVSYITSLGLDPNNYTITYSVQTP